MKGKHEDPKESSHSGESVISESNALSVRVGQHESQPQEDLRDTINLDPGLHDVDVNMPDAPDVPYQWPDRNAYDQESWGYVHSVPEPNNIERVNMFVKPYAMAEEEGTKILANYRKALLSHGNGIEGDCSLLGDHVRTGETPTERAERELETLQGLGVEITAEVESSVVDRNRETLGLRGALAIYLQGKTHCELKYVDELFRQLDRAQLEATSQLSWQERLRSELLDKEGGAQKKLKEQDDRIAVLEEQIESARHRQLAQDSKMQAKAQQLAEQLDALRIDYEARNSESKELERTVTEVMKSRDLARKECDELNEKVRTADELYTHAMARVREGERRAEAQLAQKAQMTMKMSNLEREVEHVKEQMDLLAQHFRLLKERKG